MSDIINLSYSLIDNTFFFIDKTKIDPKYRNDFSIFMKQIIDGVNLPNPNASVAIRSVEDANENVTVETYESSGAGETLGFLNGDTGEGAIPFIQTIDIENILAENILTGYDPTTVYSFVILESQAFYRFSALGSQLTTYQDVQNLIESNAPVSTIWSWVPGIATPELQIIANTNVAFINNTDNNQQTLQNASTVKLIEFANEIYGADNDNADGLYQQLGLNASEGSNASVTLPLPTPIAAEILTLVDVNTETVFSFDVGQNRGLSVQGTQARTYQDLTNTIDKFDGIGALFDNDTYKLHMYIPVPKIPKMSNVQIPASEVDPKIIITNTLLQSELLKYSSNEITIDDFTGLAKNSQIVHVIQNPVYGGYDLLTTIQYSKRTNGSYWSEVITISNTKKSPEEISSQIPEQKALFDAVDDVPDDVATDSDKRGMSLNIDNVTRLSGPLGNGTPTNKSDAVGTAIIGVPSAIETFNNPDPILAPSDVANVSEDVIESGYAPGAVDANGNVLDESLLTPAQKAKLVPATRTTVS